MKRTVVSATCLSLFCAATGANASQQINEGGTECKFYSGTSSQDPFIRAQGVGSTLRNVSASPAKAVCPVNWDAYAATENVQIWTLDGSGTSGWDLTKCNFYGQAMSTGFAFPSSANTLDHRIAGFTTLQGVLLPGSMYFGSGQIEIICSIPSGASIMDYRVDIDEPNI